MIDDSDAGVNLLFSKARVALIKKLDIPRLELLAVLIGVRMLNFIQVVNFNSPWKRSSFKQTINVSFTGL